MTLATAAIISGGAFMLRPVAWQGFLLIRAETAPRHRALLLTLWRCFVAALSGDGVEPPNNRLLNG